MTAKRKILIAVIALLVIASATLTIIITPEVQMKNNLQNFTTSVYFQNVQMIRNRMIFYFLYFCKKYSSGLPNSYGGSA